MGLYSQTANDVQLRWRPNEEAVVNAKSSCLPSWVVSNVSSESLRLEYSTGDYTYANAAVSFTRIPSSMFRAFLLPAVFLVGISFLGFFINPAATPARVTLGVVTILAVTNNLANLVTNKLSSAKPTWIADFLVMSLVFNVVAFAEQIMVNLGITTHAWLLDYQQTIAKARVTARVSLAGAHSTVADLVSGLVEAKDHIIALFEEADVDNDGLVTLQEWKHIMRQDLGVVEGVPDLLTEAYQQLKQSKAKDLKRTDLLLHLERLARRSQKQKVSAILSRQLSTFNPSAVSAQAVAAAEDSSASACGPSPSPSPSPSPAPPAAAAWPRSVEVAAVARTSSTTDGVSVQEALRRHEEADDDMVDDHEVVAPAAALALPTPTPTKNTAVRRATISSAVLVAPQPQRRPSSPAVAAVDRIDVDLKSEVSEPSLATARPSPGRHAGHHAHLRAPNMHRNMHMESRLTRLLEYRIISRSNKKRLFPYLARMRFLDHYFRVIWLPIYLIAVSVALAKVEFGQAAWREIRASPCYTWQ